VTSVLIFPYRTPSAGALEEPVWTINGQPIDSVDLTGIDYHTMLEVGCSIQVNPEELERSTRQAKSELTFVLSARADAVGEFSVIARADVAGGDVKLIGSVRVAELGDVAKLQVQLVRTTTTVPEVDGLVAKHKCALLWTRTEKLRLSGVGARLSVQAVDFVDDPIYRGVLWQVELETADPQVSVSSAVQVLLNSRHEDLVTLLQSSQPQTLSERLVKRQLQLDVARQFVLAARSFEGEGAAELAALPYESIGSVAIRFAERLRAAGGLRTRADLWTLCDSSPTRFEMLLQSVHLAPALGAQ